MAAKSIVVTGNAATSASPTPTVHAKSPVPKPAQDPVCPSFAARLRLVCGHCLRVAAALPVGYIFATTAWRVRDAPQDLAFVIAATSLLAALLACLRRADRLTTDSPAGERRLVQAAVWALSTSLSCAFAYRVAAVMPPMLAVLVWCMTAVVALVGLCPLVVCRDQQYQPWFMVVTVSILGLVFLAHTFGAINLDLVLNTNLGMRRGSGNTMSNSFDPSHGRMLLAINQDTEEKSSVGVDTRMTEENADGPWKDQKALAPWISNQKSDQSGKGFEETTKKLNGTEGPYLSARKTIKTSVILWVAIPSAILFCCTAVLLWYKCGNRLQQNETLVELELWQVSGPRKFQYNELVAATRNFTNENKIGQGGFGPVYRGILRNRHVAIKKLSEHPSSWQGPREFSSEVNVMAQLRHRNIVQLLGWCSSNRGLLLVYELMAQGSLETHLYSADRILSWQQRYKIILDLSSALFYLHQCCDKCIVHGDIKPENIMLDASYSAKLGDFGTARLLDREGDPRTTGLIAGTRGYIDPMYVNNHVRCPEADVYSFGVTLLEIACGKRAWSQLPDGTFALVPWVRGFYDQNMILDAADEKLNAEFDQKEMEHVLVTGLWCTLPELSQRPSIAKAIDVLRFPDGDLPLLPHRRDPQLAHMMHGLINDIPSVDAENATTYITSRAATEYLLAEE